MGKLFYESGYNAVPWTLSKEPAIDVFYYDLTNIPGSQELIPALRKAAEKVFQNHPILLDDGSLEAAILKLLLPKNFSGRIQSWPCDFTINVDQSLKWQKDTRLSDPELHLLLQYAQHTQAILIAPRAWLRVINMNWAHNKNQSYGTAYWTYTENERHHCMQMVQRTEKITVEMNILKWSAEVYKAYFNHSALLDFFLSSTAADNYLIERNILLDLYKKLGGDPSTVLLHKQPWKIPASLTIALEPIPMQQSIFPLHNFYEKYFQQPLQVNANERHLYGEV